MRRMQGILLGSLLGSWIAMGCTTPTPPEDRVDLHSSWADQMSAGLACSELQRLEDAARHYRRAVQLARSESLPETKLAFSLYRLGDVLREKPELGRGERADVLLQEARVRFERVYGSNHSVLIPVWANLASLYDERGEVAAARAARASAKRIAGHLFPEHHALRRRLRSGRPARRPHPLEVLSILGTQEEALPKRLVRAPN